MRLLTLAVGLIICTSGYLTADETARSPAQPGPPFAGQGILVGEVTSGSAVVQVRLTGTDQLVERDLPGMDGVVEFNLQPFAQPDQKPVTQTVQASEAHDFIARTVFEKLRPGVRYICTTRIGTDADHLQHGPAAEFRTLPGPKQARRVKFVVVTGMNYAKFHGDDRIDREQHKIENNTDLPRPYAGIDHQLGYPSLVSILRHNPDFFVGTGDNVYYDTPDKPRAETIPQLRQKWHEQFVQLRYRELFSHVPTYWMIDDHDYRYDDCDNSGDYDPSPAVGRRMMLEQLPLAAHENEDALTYRTHRVSRDLQIWLPEGRMYRSPNALEDGPEKTIWGEKQKAWLKQTLAESDAKFKLLISPTPLVGPDDLRKKDNHCDVGGFRHEQQEFFNWLKETGLDRKHFYIVCGDRHWQYHSIDPSGIEEFSCGALVDANSRLGRKPGDPQSTDPEALIKQPYYQNPRSGGFLSIEVGNVKETPTLTFRWFDENGKLLHSDQKE